MPRYERKLTTTPASFFPSTQLSSSAAAKQSESTQNSAEVPFLTENPLFSLPMPGNMNIPAGNPIQVHSAWILQPSCFSRPRSFWSSVILL